MQYFRSRFLLQARVFAGWNLDVAFGLETDSTRDRNEVVPIIRVALRIVQWRRCCAAEPLRANQRDEGMDRF